MPGIGRRAAMFLALTLLPGVPLVFAAGHYLPTEASLATHPLPKWYDDAKLGIFVHWGLYSVPGYATLDTVGFDKAQADKNKYQWYKNNAYAEWYYNTLLIDGSPTQAYHAKKYGKDFNYYSFAKTFNEQTRKWNPDSWAKLFKETGAGYVVLTSKHHDGFTLWPSKLVNPHLAPDQRHSERDLAGDLSKAVKGAGMRMGFYYSSVFDWSFLPGPIRVSEDEARLRNGQSPEYVKYADAQFRELLEHYNPDIAWSDIGYPPGGHPLELIADFYNRNPDGVANNRWGPFKFGDFTTPEYKVADAIQAKKWEECRGIGRSFGLNRLEGEKETIPADELVRNFVDVVSKNGNLLLDVGPEPDGTIPAIQVDRLHKLGAWLKQNGDAIFATRPWNRAEGKTADGIDVRFTRKGDVLYAVLLAKPTGASVTLKDVPAPEHGRATLLGAPGALSATAVGADLKVSLPASLPGNYAWAIKLE